MATELVTRAKHILEQILYITIATVDTVGEPWNAPVFSAHDEQYNFYWGSHRDSQHSKNIRTTKKAFFVIYDSTVQAGKGEGVYIQASVTEISNPTEIEVAHKLLSDRHTIPYWKLDELKGDAPIRLYKPTPLKIWMNDEGEKDGHYIDVRTEVRLLE